MEVNKNIYDDIICNRYRSRSGTGSIQRTRNVAGKGKAKGAFQQECGAAIVCTGKQKDLADT